MDEALAQTFWIREHRVYGLTLRPWCLLASLRLAALGNAWATGQRATPLDTWIAAQVCAAGLGPINLRPLSIFTGIRHRFERQRKAFSVYLDDHETSPEYWVSNGADYEAETPWQLRHAVWCMQELGMTWEAAMTMPMGQVLWLRGAFSERAEMREGRPSPIYGPKARANAELLAKLNGGING